MSDDIKTSESNDRWELLHHDVYTPQQAAEVLHMSERTILNAAYGGDLPAVIINGDVVEITRSDLVAWLKWRENN